MDENSDTDTENSVQKTEETDKNDGTEDGMEVKVEINDEFTCKTCGRVFATKSGCISHARYCKKKNFSKTFCNLCKQQFSKEKDFQRHLKKEHSVKKERKNGMVLSIAVTRYECPKCDRRYLAAGALKLHTKSCKGLTLSKFCKLCNVKFCSDDSLRRHMRRRHERKEEEIPDCEKCGRCFKRKSDRTKHINTGCTEGNEDVKNIIDGEKVLGTCTFACKKCDVKFSRMRELKRHTLAGCGEFGNRKKQVCPVCDTTFTGRTGLRRHMEKLHGGMKLLEHTCTICSATFNSEYTLERHMTHHREVKRHMCEICGNDFKFRTGLNRHLRKHAGLRYSCELCPKAFTAKHSLKKHMLWHEGIRPYVCEKCGDTFRERAKLLRHMKIHAGIRQYECNVCQKRFVLKEYLKSHEKIHSASTSTEDMFFCDMCPYKTFRKVSMRTHKRTHFMRRDFKCNACERTFTQKHSLLYHQKLHLKSSSNKRAAYTTKPTLFCSQCPKGFTTQRGLVRHTQKHVKGLLPVLKPGGFIARSKSQGETPDNVDSPQSDNISQQNAAPQNIEPKNTDLQNPENDDPLLSQRIKVKKRMRNELSASQMSSNIDPHVISLSNRNKGSLTETGALLKTTLSDFSDMNISEGIIAPTNSHGMQGMNNEGFNTLRWPVPDVRADHGPQTGFGDKGFGLHSIEMYHSMLDVEKRVGHTGMADNMANLNTIDRNRKLLRDPVFGRESAFGLYTPTSVVPAFETGTTGLPHGTTGLPHWTSCRFSQPEDLSSKFGVPHVEFGKDPGSKVTDVNHSVYNKTNQSTIVTSMNDKPLSLVRHSDDNNDDNDAFNDDTDIEDYGNNVPADETANKHKTVDEKDTNGNLNEEDLICDVQCNKCSAKFYSFNGLKMHLMQGCGKGTG